MIGAGLVMIEPGFGEPDLARIAEPALVGVPRTAIFVIGVDLDDRARLIGMGVASEDQTKAPGARLARRRPRIAALLSQAWTARTGGPMSFRL